MLAVEIITIVSIGLASVVIGVITGMLRVAWPKVIAALCYDGMRVVTLPRVAAWPAYAHAA